MRVQTIRPEGFQRLVAALLRAAREHDARAGPRERLAYRQPDTRRAARHEGDAAIHPELFYHRFISDRPSITTGP